MNSPFKTAEEQETARRLGFKLPGGKPIPGGVARPTDTVAPQQYTFVAAYFNPNDFPVSIMMSEIGYNIELMRKNEEVEVIVKGVKTPANDPILEQHVGNKALARRMSKVKVPITFLPRSVARPLSNQSSVHSAKSFVSVKGGHGNEVRPVFEPRVIPPEGPMALPPPGTGSPVMSMTVETAKKLGLVKPTRPVIETPRVVDTDGEPTRNAPEIDYAVDMTPGEVRRLRAQQQPPAPMPAPQPIMEAEQPPEPPPVLGTSSTIKSIISNTLSSIGLGASTPTETAPEPEVVPEPEPAPTTEQARLTEQANVQQGLANAGISQVTTGRPPNRFVCPKCGEAESFPFRSDLERHARRLHTDDADAIMASYPKAPTKRANAQ
jgi:hypothetical protein